MTLPYNEQSFEEEQRRIAATLFTKEGHGFLAIAALIYPVVRVDGVRYDGPHGADCGLWKLYDDG